MRQRIYLDYNATTPLDKRVLNAVVKELQNEAGNPSSIHYHGQQSRHILEESRKTIADYLKVRHQEIIFTSGGTEGAFLLINGVIRKETMGHLITSDAEHSAVYQTVKQLVEDGYEATFLPAGEWGAVKPEAIKAAIRPDTKLICLMAANNETGVRTDIEGIAAIAQQTHIPFIVDAVGILGKETFTIPPGVTAAFFSGHKVHAPKGVGFYFCRQSLKLKSIMVGGSQEFNKRPGTENLAGIVGLSEAIRILSEGQSQFTRHMSHLKDKLELGILSLGDVVINGTGPRIANTTNLSFTGIDGESLIMNLDKEGLSVSHGSACTSGALEPSRVLINMGIPLKQARSAIRFSIGRTTTEAEIDEAILIVRRVVEKMRHAK